MQIKKIITTTISAIIASQCIAQTHLYVSTSGSDNGNGTVNHPFLSINKALNSREALMQTSDSLIINIKKGTYYINSAINITRRLSRPIALRGDAAGGSVVSGGMVIKGWKLYKNGIYRTFIPQVKNNGLRFEQLYVNGTRATLSRTPNSGWLHINGLNETKNGGNAMRHISLNGNDLSSIRNISQSDLRQMKFQFFQRWDVITWKANDMNVNSRQINFTSGQMKPWNVIAKDTRFIMYNYLNGIDEAREWFLDSQNGYLYYKPSEDENMAEADVIAPVTAQLLNISGGATGNIQNIKFENLSFENASHLTPNGGDGPEQAAAQVEAAIELNNADNISFINCNIMHTGGYGIFIGRNCAYNVVSHCTIKDMGAGGIKIGEMNYTKGMAISHDNIVDNNIIHHLGRDIACGAGVLIMNAKNNKITHNDISDLYYSGISAGWTWGYNDGSKFNPCVGNTISYNNIHDAGQGVLSDLAGIYTLGEQPGTMITNNVVHDVVAADYGGCGIYADEGSSYLTIKNNLVYNCTHGAFQLNYGKSNEVTNNIFAFCKNYMMLYVTQEKHEQFSLKHNIILQNSGTTVNGCMSWIEGDIDVDNNLYWNTNGSLNFASRTFDEWKKVKDKNAVQADPLFKDAANYNFTFTSTRNADRINFKPFDYSKAGVYGSVGWKLKAEL
jgi:hypothetical protein